MKTDKICVHSNGAILAIGGAGSTDFETTVELLDPERKAWKYGPGLPYGIRGAVAVQGPMGEIILVGGKVIGLFHRLSRKKGLPIFKVSQ